MYRYQEPFNEISNVINTILSFYMFLKKINDDPHHCEGGQSLILEEIHAFCEKTFVLVGIISFKLTLYLISSSYMHQYITTALYSISPLTTVGQKSI